MILKRFDCFSKHGFTMAEMLIVLAVIGLVAAMTLPTLITNVNEKAKTDRQANIVFKITQATDKMKADGKLKKFANTDAFVSELQKYIKVAKVCDSNHIADCWPSSTVIDVNGKEMNVSTAKTGSYLGFKDAPGKADNNTVGVILADGANLIMVYDNTNEGLVETEPLIANSYTLPYGNKYEVYKAYTTNSTSGLSFVTDINGKKGPNKDMQTVDENSVTYDIRSFNGAHFGTGCAGAVVEGKCYFAVPSYTAITCSKTQNREYCNWSDSYANGSSGASYTSYHAGAKKACVDLDMKMISLGELNLLIANGGSLLYKIAPADWTSVWADNASNSSSTSSTTPNYSSCAEYGTCYSCDGEGGCYSYSCCKKYNQSTTYNRNKGSASSSYKSGSSFGTHSSSVDTANTKVICVEN